MYIMRLKKIYRLVNLQAELMLLGLSGAYRYNRLCDLMEAEALSLGIDTDFISLCCMIEFDSIHPYKSIDL